MSGLLEGWDWFTMLTKSGEGCRIFAACKSQSVMVLHISAGVTFGITAGCACRAKPSGISNQLVAMQIIATVMTHRRPLENS